MHIVSCSTCGQTVEIAPGAAICSSCGEDLNKLIPAEGTPQHYYARAELLVDQDDPEGALQVVQDGLENVLSSDLLLLGAILGEKVGHYDLMRHYVSRIPVDDTLRSEGEWLLRAHQARQRAQRQGRDPSRAILDQLAEEFAVSSNSDSETLNVGGNRSGLPSDRIDPRNSDEYIGRIAESPRRLRLAPAFALLGLLLLFGAGWFYSDRLLSQPWVPTVLRTTPNVEVSSPVSGETSSNNSGTTGTNVTSTGANGAVNGTSADSATSGQTDAQPNVGVNSDGSTSQNASGQTEGGELLSSQSPDNALPSDDAAPNGEVPSPTISPEQLLNLYQNQPDAGEPVPGPTGDGQTIPGSAEPGSIVPDNSAPVQTIPQDSQPSDSVPDNVADVSNPDATPEPIADSDPQSIVEAIAQEPFDILKYLRDAGRSDLAELPLDAQIVDGKLFVSGVVKWFEERDAIITALSFAPGVADVNPIGLKIRTPETYTVQEADTLWIIAFRIYGDGARWPEIYELNQDVLISPDALGLGQVLKVPTR